MARKPIVGTVANNVLEYGVGGINIDGCRIGTDDTRGKASMTAMGQNSGWNAHDNKEVIAGSECGRFPANIIFDEEAGKILDEQSGISKSSGGSGDKSMGALGKNGKYGNYALDVKAANLGGLGDTGGASRFFYCPKAKAKDRDSGIETDAKALRATKGGTRDFNARCASCGKKFIGSPETICSCDNPITDNQVFKRKNNHPTVKPTDLMKYLIRLVTPKDGIVLDPFMGSGSTGKAAMQEGMWFVGIEREREYFEIAKQRIEYEADKRKFW
jgi:site-specific DNA-methyltransferase (adenine-specific)